MSYFVKQKIGKNIYIYEVTSYWDSISKKTKQKRKYVGKFTQEGEIITPKKSTYPISAENFGDIYLLEQIADSIGLCDILDSVFPDKAKDILYMAIFIIIDGKNIYNYENWIDNSFFKSHVDLNKNYIIDLLRYLTKLEEKRNSFFNLWSAKQGDFKSIYFDISLTLNPNNIIEWYYNDDTLRFNINFGIVLSKNTNMPIFYSLYGNNIPNINLLNEMSNSSESITNDIEQFVINSSFCTQNDIEKIDLLKINFLLPINTNSILPQRFLNKIFNVTNLKPFEFKENSYLYTKKDFSSGKLKLKLHLFLDEQKRLIQIDNFMRKLSDLEVIISNTSFNKINDIKLFMENRLKGSSKLYDISFYNNKVSLKKKKWTLSKKLNKAGKMAILTNDHFLNNKTILLFKEEKDQMETFFNSLNMELGKYGFYTQSKQFLDGRFFLQFVAFIIYKALKLKMSQNGLLEKYTPNDLLESLRNIKAIRLSNGKTILSKINNSQKFIFNTLNIDISREIL